MNDTKKTESDMVDVEMANDATTAEQSIPKRQSRRRRVYEHKLTIDNLSPQVWCMEPRILIDAQAKKRFSPDRPAELTNLSPEVWSEFQDNLLSTWRFSRNEALKTFILVFLFILILVILNAIVGEAFILIILLVSAVTAAFYSIRHQVIRGDRIRTVVSQYNDSFDEAGYHLDHSDLCGTVLNVTISW